MTTKDKTGDRLVASIRRTRAGAEGAGETATSASPAPKKAAAKKAAPRKAAPANTAKPARKRAEPKPDTGRDSYHSGRRVWPD